MFVQSAHEQVETMRHELGHVFGPQQLLARAHDYHFIRPIEVEHPRVIERRAKNEAEPVALLAQDEEVGGSKPRGSISKNQRGLLERLVGVAHRIHFPRSLRRP